MGSDEEEKEEREEKGTGVLKRKHESEAEDSCKKPSKLTKQELYKAPTGEELNHLKETERLFHSNIFRLQIEELLSELKLKEKYKKLFEKWLNEFKAFLNELEESGKYNLADQEWIESLTVKVPFKPQASEQGFFRFTKPSGVDVVGSYAVGIHLGKDTFVDIKLEISKKVFQPSDSGDHKYPLKRALYLSCLADKLKQSSLADNIVFSYLHGDILKPVLHLRPKGILGKKVTVQLLPVMSSEVFKPSKFFPGKSNLRSEMDSAPATPHYNSSALIDLTMSSQEEFKAKILGHHESIKEAITLLKVWLRQRELDLGYGSVSGFIMTMYVVFLLQTRKLNVMMSNYQIMRNVWNNLAMSDWTTKGISLCRKAEGLPTLEEFHTHFEVVFVDITGSLDYCSNMSRATFFRLRHEASQAVTFLDNTSVNGFEPLFMVPMPFLYTYDHIIRIPNDEELVQVTTKKGKETEHLDYSGNVVPTSTKILEELLRKGLGKRVNLLGLKLTPVPKWELDQEPPSLTEEISFGLLINPEFALSVLEKGPEADAPDAKDFRNFWGSKSELRRFQDSRICEAVVWKAENISEKRLICKQITSYLLSTQLGLKSVTYIADQLEPLLTLPRNNYGTGEEANMTVLRAYDLLSKDLRSIEGLPLAISSIQGVSAVFRGTHVFPPLLKRELPQKLVKSVRQRGNCQVFKGECKNSPPWIEPVDVLINLEGSSKWPENPEAILRVKAAFYFEMSKILGKKPEYLTQMYPDRLEIFRDGLIFRLKIAYHRESILLKMALTPDGKQELIENAKSQKVEKETLLIPKLSSAIQGLNQQFFVYGVSCGLVKRWIWAHLLGDHIGEQCVELLVAHLFLNSAPFAPPNQPQVALVRFLHFVSSTDWNVTPIIINWNDQLTKNDIGEIHNHFIANRQSLPSIFISTPLDKLNSIWTRDSPSTTILIRLVQLAKESLAVLKNQFFQPEIADFKQVFRPPLNPYDVTIHLRPNMLSRRYQSVDTKIFNLDAAEQNDSKSTNEVIPVVDFDPVQCYLRDLRASFGHLALFFHDKFGGKVIGVVWKPAACQPTEFKVNGVQAYTYTEVTGNGRGKMVPNMEAIMQDFQLLGEGLVRKIDIRSEQWTIN